METNNIKCPSCNSIDIVRRHIYVSVYGTVPEKPRDFCKKCGFTSYEKFETINFVNLRDDRINKILNNNKNGI